MPKANKSKFNYRKVLKKKMKAETKRVKTKSKPKKVVPAPLPHPSTAEQKNGVHDVVDGNSFEGVRRIDHLPLEEQMSQVFNPLQGITRTEVKDAPSEATFVVNPKPAPKG